MKIRFGFTCRGTADLPIEEFAGLCHDLERLNFDSVWLPETMLTGSFDPLVALAHAASSTERLKIGSHVVFPGRAPVRLARELAQLDRLSAGRLLLIAVLGLPDAREVAAQGVMSAERGSMLDEMVPLMRRLWKGETVNHSGTFFELSEASIDPLPVQKPLELWFGGTLRGALRRAGQIGDGYIPGLSTPDEGAERKLLVEAAASEFNRTIDPEHFGVNLTYSRGSLSVAARDALVQRRPDVDPNKLVPSSRNALLETIDAWIDAGYSKFLLRPVTPPPNWTEELELLASEVLSRQS
ncbi:MAG: LLM class flavin-dependent oxidoreductase [Acidimicrobiales bacterium]|nr:LLM class flavin-dependent oxidoreductase [Acidimicrobiales bacterium]